MTTIVFALIAAFVVWKLRSVLGTRSGTEKPPTNPFAASGRSGLGVPRRESGGKVIPLPGAARPPVQPALANTDRWKPYAEPGSTAWAGLDAIAAVDPSFAIKPFIDGARSAYEIIIAAFAEGKRDSLRRLLSADVFEGFAAAIDGRERRGEKLTTQIVSIDKIAIEDAALRGRTAEIRLHYSAQMITTTRNGAGAVTDGDAEKTIQIDDIWTFTRDIGSSDPNWKLSATGTAG